MVIYLITNTLNGKKYIGQTIQDPEFRFYQHSKDIRSNSPISKSIQKHGIENFTQEIVDSADTMEELNLKEEYWIYSLDLVSSGYNCKSGGSNGRHSEESKLKLSKAHTGKVLTESHKANISKALRDSEKFKNADKGKFFRENNPSKNEASKAKIARAKYKPIYCTNNGICYLSLKLAAEDLELRQNSMSTALTRGNRIHGYKFYYIYK